MSQAANSPNTMSVTLQLQMVNAINQQSALFTQMNTIMETLVGGFNQLTQAIKANTEVILKNAVGSSSGLADVLSKVMGIIPARQAVGLKTAFPSDITGAKLGAVDDLLELMFKNLQTVTASIAPLASPSGGGNVGRRPLGVTDEFDTAKANLKDSFQYIANASSPLATIGRTFQSIKPVANNVFGGMKGAFATMAPQMMMLALVMEPVMALIGGLLEPFSMITDMFGAFGEILGTAFLPMLQNSIMPLLQAFLPIFTTLAQVLGPVIQLLFNFSGIGILIQVLTPLMPLITTLVTLFGQIMTALSPLILVISNIISLGIGAIFEAIGKAFGGLGINMEDITKGITKFAEIIGTVAELLMGVIDLIAGRITAGDFKKLGFSETSWL
jgi:phage-related protein